MISLYDRSYAELYSKSIPAADIASRCFSVTSV